MGNKNEPLRAYLQVMNYGISHKPDNIATNTLPFKFSRYNK